MKNFKLQISQSELYNELGFFPLKKKHIAIFGVITISLGVEQSVLSEAFYQQCVINSF